VLVRQMSAPERALAAVADGVTTCDVGTGALASERACAAVEAAVTPDWRRADFEAQIGGVCRGAAEGLLEWALANGHGPELAAGGDLMGTTLAAAWLEGRAATLANLGDSRAYLVRGGRAEQLTVDGDVGTALLAAGVAPEDVRQAGELTGALRNCIGGCTRGADGQPMIQEEFCRPALSTWPLAPGDVLVLCTDGLVDEGAFLSPADLAAIVTANAGLSAEELAVRLADAADELQRLPSAEEPWGFGDNIGCVVIQVEAGG
jgi:serine/threonine protein phosphatase PrpC